MLSKLKSEEDGWEFFQYLKHHAVVRFEQRQKLKFGIYDVDTTSHRLEDQDYLGHVITSLGELEKLAFSSTKAVPLLQIKSIVIIRIANIFLGHLMIFLSVI